MKAPDKIYLYGDAIHSEPTQRYGYEPRTGKYRGQSILSVPYIREDIVNETIATAEDHAYFAGKEKLREELLEWAEAKKSELFNGEPTDVAAGINAGIDMIIKKLKSL